MIRAVVLFRSGGRVPKAVGLATQLRSLESVKDAYAVFGRYDVIAFLECKDVNALFRAVSEATRMEGIMSSDTLMEILPNQESHEYGRGPFSS
jgi:uncharacterized protein with GYD domain